ncbi:MAG: hypothetical protein NTU51_03095 [Bacteroidetes bacterium]|nr:hypothetical protein [Bacteroidota bacterium]
MKPTFYIIVTFFGLQSGFLFANGSSAQTIGTGMLSYHTYTTHVNSVPEVSAITSSDLNVLAPVTPSEADFNDNDLVIASVPSTVLLAPVTPEEADFSDSDAGNLNLLIPYLSPCIPSEADFLDTDTVVGGDSPSLAPVLPSEASFDDIV